MISIIFNENELPAYLSCWSDKKGAIVEWEEVHMTYFYKRHSLVDEGNYPFLRWSPCIK